MNMDGQLALIFQTKNAKYAINSHKIIIICLTIMGAIRTMRLPFGAIAQLGERYTGSVEVGGSIPPSSTKFIVLKKHCQI